MIVRSSLEELFPIIEYLPRTWNPNIPFKMNEGGLLPSKMSEERASNRGYPNKGLNLDQGGGSGRRGSITVTWSHQRYVCVICTLADVFCLICLNVPPKDNHHIILSVFMQGIVTWEKRQSWNKRRAFIWVLRNALWGGWIWCFLGSTAIQIVSSVSQVWSI